MEALIRECAEKIVRVLRGAQGVNLLRLSEHLTERSMIVYQAVGWLAREGRVRYEQREKQVYITLRTVDTSGGGTGGRAAPG